jgi:hypothetical protein
MIAAGIITLIILPSKIRPPLEEEKRDGVKK